MKLAESSPVVAERYVVREVWVVSHDLLGAVELAQCLLKAALFVQEAACGKVKYYTRSQQSIHQATIGS